MSISELPSGRWRLQIRRRTIQHDQLYDSLEEAERIQEELLSRKETDKKLTLTTLNEQYQESHDFSRKSVETQRTERSRIKHVLEKFGSYTLQELQENTELIYDYIDDRLRQKNKRTGKKVGATSVRLEVAALSALVEYAKKRKKVRENFVSHIERPTSKPRKRRIDNTEQGAMMIAARNSDPDVAQAARFQMLLRHLGCRPGELRDLRIENIRLQKNELSFIDTKNGTDRTVHTTGDARTLIELQLAS